MSTPIRNTPTTRTPGACTSRRAFIRSGASLAAASAFVTRAGATEGPRARVVVVGGGFGGATAARTLKRWAPALEVTLIERDAAFISCPLSNLVLAGNARIADLTFGYQSLERLGIRVIRGEVMAIDASTRTVRLASGERLPYDRAIVSPGVEFDLAGIPGLQAPAALAAMPIAWKAGPETLRLRQHLEAMPDGGVFVMHIPQAPYRCPPGPYERACQVADYFTREKPRSKVIVLDANPDLVSKKALFMAAWNGPYKGMVEYRPNSELADVDGPARTVKLVFDDVPGGVVNVIPPQRAGAMAEASGLVTANRRWCGVDWLTMESVAVKGVHVLGDATLSASIMPKSATMANQHAKLAAAAIIDLLADRPVEPNPTLINTCYSFVDAVRAGHVATVHAYDATERTMSVVKGSGGLSREANATEGAHAWGWARNIWGEALG